MSREMLAAVSDMWKLLLTMMLVGAVLGSVIVRAPRGPIERTDLRRLVLAAVVLYAVGLLASVSHHARLAAGVYACGILVCSLAVWLSRGLDRGDGPDGGGGGDGPSGDERPPTGPDGLPAFDWDDFDRERASWGERSPVGA